MHFLKVVLYGLFNKTKPFVFHSLISYVPYSLETIYPLAAGRTTGCCPACPRWSPGQASYWEGTFCWTGCICSCSCSWASLTCYRLLTWWAGGGTSWRKVGGSCWFTPCCPDPPAPPSRSTTGRSPPAGRAAPALFWQRRPLPATYQLSLGTINKSNNLYENPRGGSWPALGIHVIFL